MPKNKILEYAKNVVPKVTENDISELSGGYSSIAYKVTTKSPFVLLVQRPGAVNSSSYGHAFVVLQLLKTHGYKYSPLPLWLEPGQKAIAISFFDGVPADKFNFDKSNVNPKDLALKVIDADISASKISWQEYSQSMKNAGLQPLPVRSLTDDCKDYGWGWLKIVKNSCPDKYIKDWLSDRIPAVMQTVSASEETSPTFRHGDLSNPNILINHSGDFTLIDWDSSRFSTSGLEFLIAYATSLVDFMTPYKTEITSRVARYLGVSFESFDKRVYEAKRYNDVVGVNWAAMMMARINAGEIKGETNHFKKIAMDRIKAYEGEFSA
ncbi:MAG TPA: hypothetical protein VMR16_03245 [Candidatus Saccharimonadales bacterium]|nr:hypothetical protein [Candidatus Saccharimonadales bacterium]